MQNSPGSHQTSNSTAAKLLEVDSDLASVEVELLSQLESIQEKRRSLKTVLSLFTELGTPATTPIEEPAKIPVVETESELERVDKELAASPLEASSEPATASKGTKASPDIESNRARKASNSSIKRNKTTKLTPATKAAKVASGWQQYVREEFSNTSLAEAVSLVLQRHADEVFEIPTIMEAIFVDEFPQEVGNQARRLVTNILSDGARKNKWYRGQLGQYSMSRVAAKANS